MLRKSKRIICIACVLICIFPVLSYSIDKEEFLKFLIDSSYPESSNQTDDLTNKDNKETLQCAEFLFICKCKICRISLRHYNSLRLRLKCYCDNIIIVTF